MKKLISPAIALLAIGAGLLAGSDLRPFIRDLGAIAPATYSGLPLNTNIVTSLTITEVTSNSISMLGTATTPPGMEPASHFDYYQVDVNGNSVYIGSADVPVGPPGGFNVADPTTLPLLRKPLISASRKLTIR